jgi:hypothetical protein
MLLILTVKDKKNYENDLMHFIIPEAEKKNNVARQRIHS